jgi:hypothetical protein
VDEIAGSRAGEPYDAVSTEVLVPLPFPHHIARAPHAELLQVLMLPDFERADRIGEYWGNAKTRTFAELLIDCEEDRTLRAVPVGMLRESDR